jgi:hypothetical protein
MMRFDNCNDSEAQKLTTFLQFFDNFGRLVCLNVNMTKFIYKIVWTTICLNVFLSVAFGQNQNSNTSNFFTVTSPDGSSTNASRNLMGISLDSVTKIAELSGQ